MTDDPEDIWTTYARACDESDQREGYVYSMMWMDPNVPQVVCEAHEALAKARARARFRESRFDVLEANYIEAYRRWACGELKNGEGRAASAPEQET